MTLPASYCRCSRGINAHTARLPPPTFSPWDARRLLGLPAGVDARVFNLDGVLIGSASIHMAVWTETFDQYGAGRGDALRNDAADFVVSGPAEVLTHKLAAFRPESGERTLPQASHFSPGQRLGLPRIFARPR